MAPSTSIRIAAPRLCRPHPQGRKSGRPVGAISVKYKLVVNLKTAKALGLDISAAFLSIADDLIE
jgi:hypothetical protein